MRFVFRADASNESGSGHVMRLSVLAEKAIEDGFECIFIGLIQDLDWVQKRVLGIGFSRVLDSFGEYQSDPEEDVLILDSYVLDPQDPMLSLSAWKRIIAITDPQTPDYKVNLKVVPGFEKLVANEGDIKVLSGPSHLLIRNTIKKSNFHSVSDVPKVLVVGGGSDPFKFAQSMAEVLDVLEFKAEIHFVSSSKIESKFGKNYISHKFGADFDTYVNEFDLVLTTASTISMEMIAREIPVGVVSAVENQSHFYQQLGKLGLAKQIGDRAKDSGWRLKTDVILELITNSVIRQQLRSNSRGLVDLRGAERVLREIIHLDLDNN